MAAPVTLPAIQDPYGQHQQQQQQYARGYPPTDRDPRGPEPRPPHYNASPSSVNGYPPPPPGGHPQSQLPPMQHPGPRSPGYPPQDGRDDYYRSRQPPPPHYPDPYHPDYRHGGPPAQPARYPEYGQPPPQRYEYGPPPPGGPPRWDYGQGAVPMPQAAPRQRTSIACRYCRKRKIRCSGYQSAPGGKCINCSRMNQECIFQPVSSSSSTAFIPVSAVPGGVPPGTPLYGAYGQPLPPGSMGHPSQQPYPPGPPPPQGGNGYYGQPLPSPTGAYPPPYDQRGRRRAREPDDGDELRPPPPDPAMADDPRRRSPASSSAHSSPGGYMSSYGSSHPYGADPRGPPPRHSPGQASFVAMGPGSEDRASSSGPRHSNSSTPAAGQPTGVMSLGNLDNPSMDIDKNMLGRLNRGGSSSGKR
ncbi:hypothetical protein B0T11DRAFT_330397 [Plectosphaerella cucumerina]|uniref:Zn(2)-C6 fungal-type domain-containing protein n=1 Tax=Plectosphaerella cucumerina TaxID=40658 RepID=A0A8K0TB52_9PEZI|nr:hypothetical protein B0T11DRAFT_330397 [Plectosphaerella cucumerina]